MKHHSHETAKNIRHEFFVYRNGLLADNLRNSGDSHRLIFGLNLPQIVNIANNYPANEDVAIELWNSSETRECRLIAPMLYPIDKFTEETALKWISDVENIEIADNLCHKLLRKTTFAYNICNKLTNGSDLERYIALRLAINLLAMSKGIDNETMQHFAKKEIESSNTVTATAANRLLEDLSEIK